MFFENKQLVHVDDRYVHIIEYESLHEQVPAELRIELRQITPQRPIGSGHFGFVYMASLNKNNSTQVVAVKTLKGAFNAFFKELFALQRQ